jgi:ABC-type multidrug transport system fused ATPase/permease subunit
VKPPVRFTAGRALSLARRYGAPHSQWFFRGWAATVLVVAGRLAMPWPLLGIIELAGGVQMRPHGQWLSEALVWVGAYIAIAATLGYVEKAQRVRFKGFAARTVHGMRAEAVEAVRRTSSKRRMPDLLSRIIGDTARIKAEMSGILVHMSHNGLYFMGVCLVFLVVAPKLSVLFLLAGIFALAVGYAASWRISDVTTSQRKKEAQYAEYVHDLLRGRTSGRDGAELNEASARQDTSATKLIAIAAWIVHIGLAVITAAGLLLAIHEVEHGRLSTGEVFLFIAYVLTVHRRMIQVGRQMARGGKFIANMGRIDELLQSAGPQDVPTSDPPDRAGADRAVSAAAGTDTQDTEATVAKAEGHRTLVVSRDGADLMATLRMLSGDSVGIDATEGSARSAGGDGPTVGFVPQWPQVETRRISDFIPDAGLLERPEARRLGLRRVVRQLAFDSGPRVDLTPLDRYQRQALRIAELLWGDDRSTTWIVEDPVSGLPERKARRILKAVRKCAGTRDLIVTLPHPVRAPGFDRLLVVEPGGIVFDAPPSEWFAGRAETMLVHRA